MKLNDLNYTIFFSKENHIGLTYLMLVLFFFYLAENKLIANKMDNIF